MAAFSPDGNTIVTASNDNTARVWTADGTGTPIVFKGHTGRVYSAAFSPDGNTIVTASNDNTARVWHVGVVPVRLGYFAENATAKLVDGIEPCMPPASRTRYLGEDEATALARWRGCERECRGRQFNGLPVEHEACPKDGDPLQPPVTPTATGLMIPMMRFAQLVGLETSSAP